MPSIPGYQIVRLIGSGGMGEVFEARKHFAALGKELTVALKVLNKFNAGDRSAQRFLNEQRILISLQDVPGIARLYDAGMFDDGGVQRPYCAMEYVKGERTLEKWLREEKPSVREMLRFMADVCDAVHAGHMLGVCHLDLKPVNILCDVLGSPKVIDFGVSRSAEGDPAAERALLGTPEYMAPEQADPNRVSDARSDVYALGIILYEIVTGRRPYGVDRSKREGLIRSIAHAEVSHPRRRDGVPAPRRLAAIILKAIEKDPTKRHATAAQLASELRGYLVSSASFGRGGWWWSILAGVAACVLAVLLWESAMPARWGRFLFPAYSKWVMNTLPFAPPNGIAERVRVVTFDDGTRFEALAAEHGVEGVREDVGWTRRGVFAAALDRVKGSGARAVGFDLTFRENPDAREHDALLARAIRELNSRNIPVAIACTECVPMGASRLPGISETISGSAGRWGDVDFSPDWFMPVAIAESPDDPFARLSLSLVCVLSAERPEAFPRGRYNPDSQVLDYWWETSERKGLTQAVTNARSMRLTTADVSIPGQEGTLTPRRDGVVYLAEMPSRGELEAATIPLGELLSASPDQAKTMLGGRIVLFGNARSDAPDLFDHPRGDKIHGVYVHAAAIDRLLTGAYARLPLARTDLMLNACAGLGAATMFLPIFGGLFRRIGNLLVLLIGLIAGSLLTYMMTGWIIDAPGLVFVALVTGAAAVVWRLFVRREIGL